MRRICHVGLVAAVLLASCSERGPAPPASAEREGAREVRVEARVHAGKVRRVVASPEEVLAPSLPEPTRQERYEAALLEAVDFLLERDYPKALKALEKAQGFQDTGTVQREIDKVRAILAQQQAATRAVDDVKAVLDAGRAEEAARLAGAALGQHGGGDAGEELCELKRQADAVLTAGTEDTVARRARLRAEADAALREKNLRAAVLALEQVLQLGDDPDLRKQCDEARARLARYDDSRRAALERRRDPARLEEGLRLLREAAEAWDTLQIRQEIDEYTLVLEKGRDRLSVADFEVLGDLGVPAAGRVVAEELLPAFKPRYDPVERGQLGKVLAELKLEARDLADNGAARGELARLARVRYLVVGSLTPLAGVTAQARLVEVRTGLVVQTARVSAPTVEALLPRLKHLALMLMMTDEQKCAYEAKLQQAVVVVKPIEGSAPLPPPPPPPAAAPPPPPLVTYTPRPPDLGGLVIEDFQRLPVVVAPPPPPALDLVIRREDPRRRRLLSLAVELGDNLFRRGRCQEAQRHFQLALSLSDGNADIQLRIDRCKSVVAPPPPAAVVVAPPPVVVVAPARPRLAVFGFLLGCEPGLVPPAIGEWAADQLASYFGAGYEVIDRGEVCWYMGRLGITMREVLNDPAARRCLAQALNARFFVFGAIEQTHSFNVTTHLMDAETGARTGTGMIHVQDHAELKLRMHELARQTGAPPAEQAKLAKAGPETEKALNEARRLQKAGDHARAAEVARAALKADPGNVALQALQQEAEAKARQAKLEEERRRGAAERALTQEAARRKQQELAKQAAEARARAERDARARTEEARRQQGLAKQKAAEQLRAQARAAAARGNQAQAVAALQSAAALKPGDREVQRELAQARAARDQAQKEQALKEQQRRQAEQQRQREEALARVAREKAQREQAEVERRKAQEARDRSAYDGLVRQAKDLLGKKQSDAALAAAQSAQRLRPGAEAAALVRQAQQGAALAAAERKGAQARAEAERRQAEERKQREQAAAAARRRADEAAARAAKVRAFLAEGQKQMAARQLDRAVNAYREALNLDPHSGEARSSLQRAEKALADGRKPSPPPVPPVDPVARKRKADYDLAMSAARSAVQKGNYQGAVNSFNEALRLMPGDPQATAGRAQAGHLLQAVNAAEARKRDEARKADEARRQAEEARRASEFSRLLSQGQAAQRARRYGEAVQAYEQALKVRPGDPTATRGLQEARQALTAPRVPPKPPTPPPAPRAPTPAPKSPPPPPAAEYARQMQAGAALDKQGKHAEAVAAYQAALRARPGDARAAGAVRNAQLLQHLTSARAAHAARRFPDAVREYEEALKLQPADAEVKAALQRARAGKP